jgi:predicted peptidase
MAMQLDKVFGASQHLRPTWVKALAPALVLACAATSLVAQTTRDSQKMLDKSFTSSAGAVKYLLYVPANYDATKRYPLVVSLRGQGSTYIQATDNFEMAHPWIVDSIQARVPHFIMVPEPITGTWGPIGQSPSNGVMNGSSKGVLEAVEDLKKQYSLDSNRFVLTGFSLGGSGVYHIIELKPNYWAAAIPTSAGGDSNQIESMAKTPIWHHQGSTDGTAGIRMAKALDDHKYKVVRVVVDFTINNPAGWRTAVQGGAKPEDVAFKNIKAPVTLDSLRRAIAGGAKYIYTELTGGNHEAGWMGAAHNPLLATWAFSKVRGGSTVSIAYKPTDRPNGRANKATHRFLRAGTTSADITADNAANALFDLQGRQLRPIRDKHFSAWILH